MYYGSDGFSMDSIFDMFTEYLEIDNNGHFLISSPLSIDDYFEYNQSTYKWKFTEKFIEEIVNENTTL